MYKENDTIEILFILTIMTIMLLLAWYITSSLVVIGFILALYAVYTYFTHWDND